MPVQNATVLKSYFETNDKPTQQQFGDLVDTLQEARDNATASLALASSAQAIATTALSSVSGKVNRAGDTMTGALVINGTADTGQLIVRESSIQSTGSTAEFRDFAGNILLGVGPGTGAYVQGFQDATQFYVIGHTSQTTDILKVQNSAFADVFSVGLSTGVRAVGRQDVTQFQVRAFSSQTNAQALFSVLNNAASAIWQQWNSGEIQTNCGNNATCLNIFGGTNSSGIQITLNGTVCFQVTNSQAWASGGLIVGAGPGSFGRIQQGTADGTIKLSDNAGTSFTALMFGGTTSSFPSIRRSTTSLLVKLADDSAFAGLSSKHLIATQGTITADQAGYDHTVTWNNAGVTFTGFKSNVTSTASNAASLLFDFQLAGTSVMKVDRTGQFTLIGNMAVTSGFIETLFVLSNYADALITAAPVVAEFSHHLTSGTAGVGHGTSVDFSMDSSTTTRQVGSRITVDWSTATHATRTARFRLFVTNSAAVTEIIRVAPASTTLIAGNLLFTDNTQDIGATGATRPRTMFLGTQLAIQQATANTVALAVTGHSLTGSDASSMINLAGTWNTTGAPTAIKLNITNTASDAASILLDLQIGGTSKWLVNKLGTAIGNNFLVTPTTLTFAATTDIDMLLAGARELALTGDITFTTSNKAAGRSVKIKILADASIRNFTFPAWIWLGTAPTSIAANKTAILSIESYSTTDASIVAAYAVQA